MAEQLFQLGERVCFFRSHDKTLELTGTIVKIHEDADLVDIEIDADGRVIEVSRTETVHLADIIGAAGAADQSTASSEETPAPEVSSEVVVEEETASGSETRRRRRSS
jgi:hypothetical protein